MSSRGSNQDCCGRSCPEAAWSSMRQSPACACLHMCPLALLTGHPSGLWEVHVSCTQTRTCFYAWDPWCFIACFGYWVRHQKFCFTSENVYLAVSMGWEKVSQMCLDFINPSSTAVWAVSKKWLLRFSNVTPCLRPQSHHDELSHHRPRATGQVTIDWSLWKVSQNKPFLLLSWFSRDLLTQ